MRKLVVSFLSLTLTLSLTAVGLEIEINTKGKASVTKSAAKGPERVSRSRGRSRGIRDRSTEPALTENHLVIKSYSRRGKLIEKVYQHDNTKVRVEGFQGGKAKMVTVNQNLLLKLKKQRGVRKIKVYRPKWNKKKQRFDLKLAHTIKVPRRVRKAKRSAAATSRSVGRSTRAPRYATLKKNGHSREKVDIVLLGDGYTSNEQGKWHVEAKRVMDQLFSREPFKSHESYFNVYRIDTVSKESGAGTSTVFSKQNALGSYFNCHNIKRLLCISSAAASRYTDNLLNSTQQDIKIVVVNDSRNGASGGEFATVSAGRGVAVYLHELGHSFGGLADEYSANGHSCNTNREPNAPNVTIQTNPGRVKWRHITGTGHFEGAKYCERECTGLTRHQSCAAYAPIGGYYIVA